MCRTCLILIGRLVVKIFKLFFQNNGQTARPTTLQPNMNYFRFAIVYKKAKRKIFGRGLVLRDIAEKLNFYLVLQGVCVYRRKIGLCWNIYGTQ